MSESCIVFLFLFSFFFCQCLGYWGRFSISNHCATDKPYWLSYCHCTKLMCPISYNSSSPICNLGPAHFLEYIIPNHWFKIASLFSVIYFYIQSTNVFETPLFKILSLLGLWGQKTYGSKTLILSIIEYFPCKGDDNIYTYT